MLIDSGGQRLPPPASSVLRSLLGHAAHADHHGRRRANAAPTVQQAAAQRISRPTGDSPMIVITYMMMLRESPCPAKRATKQLRDTAVIAGAAPAAHGRAT